MNLLGSNLKEVVSSRGEWPFSPTVGYNAVDRGDNLYQTLFAPPVRWESIREKRISEVEKEQDG
ncbi:MULTISPECIES: hypothetical protein [unclassified Okeania]|uniref:hypothetical protein n=1 Tax=unclassified Okeania TaxID=2634635 RepID=UPI00142A91F2|nr:MULTISPECIES: hypothetical protein [unclassified Okeania]NES92999.1 hypothetical protein [Okeania sp. SIO2B9]NET74878.1 hypothetical protein [Okeania sp. SIO1F9]